MRAGGGIAGKSRLKYATRTQAKTDEMNQIINETLSASGSLLVKMFTREEKSEAEFSAVNGQVRNLAMKETRSGSLFRVAMGMFTQLGPLLIYFAGGLFIIEHIDPALTVGTVTATVTLVNRLYRPVESLLDLITGYPEPDDAFIGWFMVESDLHRQGIGSSIFADVRASMKAQGYDRLEVRCPKASEPAVSFWEAQGFELVSESHNGDYPVLHLAREI